VLEKTSFALTGWKVMAELPNPVNFKAAVASITADQVREQFACGPDVSRHLEVAKQFADAGFDRLVALNGGPDPDGFHGLLRPRTRRAAQETGPRQQGK
jgi:hypothetical protein